jgi:hypothetical protein
MRHIVDDLYRGIGGEYPLVSRVKISFHRIFCARCALEVKKVETAEGIMKEFFPACDLEDRVMEQIEALSVESGESPAADISLRSWVITGVIVLISLSTSFFGIDFENVAHSQGSSFLIPIGITFGAMLTGYGAFFIGSHLKELSEHFRLR